eukprot:TRINITY_DN13712_c0_g1_i1.p1 TRINITY_DN13712_c0_g1~~TRINITY_DN13712_c0_g1_i1.p1  ORF type:complete len:320 (-),score=77.67 TRINITY_DN13712_c0_g1_i1:223-1182(-)
MEEIVESIGAELPPEEASAAFSLLQKIIGNVLQAVPGTPESIKVRTLKKQSKAIVNTLRSPKCFDFLLICGFVDTGDTLHLSEASENRDILENALELLEAFAASVGTASATATPTSNPGPTSGLRSNAVAAPERATANSRTFARRDDAEVKREAVQDELAAVRAAQKAQFNELGQQAPGARARDVKIVEAAEPEISTTCETGKKSVSKSAFDFDSRSKKEAHVNAQAQAAQDLRSLQKEKYNAFKEDPSASKSEAYKAPPSVAPGGKDESWFGGLFSGWGGGSSSASGSGGGGYGGNRDDRKGPRMKTINDLPKPVQRG